MIAIGRLTKPHGLKGELVFLPYVHDLALLPDLTDRPVCLRHKTESEQARHIVSWRQSNKRVLLRFHGCTTMDQAEELRNYEICISRRSFPPLPDDEYYWFDIEGLHVYDCAGRCLGTIADIIHTGSNDVYVVQDGTQEVLIPALQNVIRQIDITRGELHLFPIPGLLD